MSAKRRYSEVSEALTLSSASRTLVSGFETKDVNGNDTKHFKSTTVHSKAGDFTHRQLLDLLCPAWRVRRQWYGASYQGFDVNGNASLDATPSYVTWTSGVQAWNQHIHLPITSKAITPCTYSLEELVNKSTDVNNFSLVTANPANTALTGPFSDLTTGQFEQQFNYRGGYVEHTFTNTCNHNLHMEFFISTPRRFLAGEGTYGGGGFVQGTPGAYSSNPASLALYSELKNQPLVNVKVPIDPGDAVNTTSDIMFTYRKQQSLLHYNWKVSAPKRATLLPGQTLKFTVQLPAFRFTNSDWNTTLFALQARTGKPTYAPFCTVILDVRARAELAHNADYSAVTYGSGTYTHIQNEYHNCRAIPFASTNNVVTINDISTASGSDLVINPLTEAEQAFID